MAFVGKKVLVTGGASGIGRAIVDQLLAEKATVTVLDNSEISLKTLKGECPSVNTMVCDVGKWSQTRSIVKSIGPLDHLVNNAGILGRVPLLNIEEADVDNMVNVNLKSVINITQVVAAGMIENKVPGSIVNISSMASKWAAGGLLLYGATKGAVNNVTKATALELGKFGIRVNAICPYIVNTDMTKGATMDEDMLARITQRSCIRRLIAPSEVADLTLFLLSSKSAMITGQAVFIDGGATTN